MRVVVLGAGAGGGFPQWNSAGPATTRCLAGDDRVKPRTQASIAIETGPGSWFLINASPDLRQQILANAILHPPGPGRSTPISGVVLTSGEVDAIAGLLTLRERQAIGVYATATVLDILAENPIFDVLARDVVARVPVALDQAFALPKRDGTESGVTCTLFAVAGKTPLYLEQGDAPPMTMDGTTVGTKLSQGGTDLFFIPGCAAMTAHLAARLRDAACVLFDGTLWQDDEMILAGVGAKTGRRMGHLSVSGPDGTIAAFAPLGVGRKIFIHINNTNPLLVEDSPEHDAARAAGWEIAHDGMEISA